MLLSQLRRCRSVPVLALLVVFACAANEIQATTFYPDVMGDTVWYRDISENTKTPGDPEPLYGPPTALVDTLDFNPNNYDFFASSNTAMVDSTDGALSLMIVAKPGYTLDTISIDESGFVNLFSLTGDPYASVTGLIELTINDIDGVPVAPISLPSLIPTYTPSDGTYQHSVDATQPQYTAGWKGSAQIDLFDSLNGNQIAYTEGVTKVTLRIDNVLLAAAGGDGSWASIDKKSFSITTDTVPIVPEPATLGLALVGGIGAMLMRRRQGRHLASLAS